MYDNDQDHIDYIKTYIGKFSGLKPRILVQSKMDLIEGPNQMIIQQEELAKELGGIKIYKQISVRSGKFQEALDAVTMVCMDPSKGLTEQNLLIAKQQNDSSFFEDYLGLTNGQAAVGVTILASASFFLLKAYAKHKLRLNR